MLINFNEKEFIILKKVLNYYKIDLLCQFSETIDLDEDVVSFFREAVGNYMSIFGFDENYNVNSDGLILESLIDKFEN